MSDFDSMLSSLLSDPAQMEKISSMAKSLMGEGGAEKAEEEAPLDMGMRANESARRQRAQAA